MNRRTISGVLVAWLLVGCSSTGGGINVGDRAPEFAVKTIGGGKTITLKDFKRKKAVLVNLFNTWCPPCRVETPDLVKVYGLYQSRGVEFISICTPWNGDTAEAAGDFAKAFGIPWAMTFDEKGAAANAFQVKGVPTNCVIDAEGHIAFYLAGALEEKDVKLVLDAVLAGKPVPRVYP